MTYRERRETKAARLREWAQRRQENAAAVFKQGEHFRGDNAFNTQPGHIPERARLIAREDRAFESLRKAESMESRAGNIESAADRAIYSDDLDAIESLTARIASLEAERDRIKAYNVSCRKGQMDESLLDDNQRDDLHSCRRVAGYSIGKHGEMPGYALTNLSGNIAKQRERLNCLTGTPDTSLRCYACRRKISKPKTCTACGTPVNLCGYCAWKPATTICEEPCKEASA